MKERGTHRSKRTTTPVSRDCEKTVSIFECYLNGLLRIVTEFFGQDTTIGLNCAQFASQLSCPKAFRASCEERLAEVTLLLSAVIIMIESLLGDTSGTFTDQQLVDLGISLITFSLCFDLKLGLVSRQMVRQFGALLSALGSLPPPSQLPIIISVTPLVLSTPGTSGLTCGVCFHTYCARFSDQQMRTLCLQQMCPQCLA